MAENLKVTHYSDGTPIDYITSNPGWANLDSADNAYCFYNNDIFSGYGALYTWTTATKGLSDSLNPSNTQGVCPIGWHIPSEAEWNELFNYVGGQSIAGNRLKSTEDWYDNGNGTNQYDFNAKPGGIQTCISGSEELNFEDLSKIGYWWCSDFGSNAKMMSIFAEDKYAWFFELHVEYGLSVRCLKNKTIPSQALISISHETLFFREDENVKTFTISNLSNSEDLNWTIEYSQDWLTINPTEGTNEQEITVSIDEENIPTNYENEIFIKSNGGDKSIIIIPIGGGMVAHYPFNGNANDESPNENNGIVNGATLTTDRSGIANSAYLFNGQNNCIEIPNNQSLQFDKTLTISMWIEANTNDFSCILAKDHDRHGFVCFNNMQDGVYGGYLVNNAYTDPKFSIGIGTVESNDWIHIVYVIDNTQARSYVNGELMNTTEDIDVDFSIANDENLFIGKFSDSWYPFSGKIDDVKIYNIALTEEEVVNLFNE